MKTVERERQDWIVVVVILILGFLFVILAGQLALRFSASWQMNTSMDSHIDPNTDFLTGRPDGFIEAIDPSILTPPSWINDFLTPGVSLITRTPFPPPSATVVNTTPTAAVLITNTVDATKSPTSTVVFFPATRTPTSRPKSTPTFTLTSAYTSTATIASPPTTTSQTATMTGTMTSTFTPTSTATPTATATTTVTATVTPTATNTTVPYPPEIGTTPDGVVYTLPTGGSLTLSTNLVANGDGSYDLVYYERPAPSGTGIFLDWIIVEIGDGVNWYTVFYWGNNIADTNSNMDFNILPNPQVPEEPDQRDIPTASLYNGTGIAIDIDAIVPPGTYTYIRFIAPPGDTDGQTEIDAVEVLP